MKSVRDAFVNLWRRLDWFDRVIAFIFGGGVGFSALVGDPMGATWYVVILVLWCSAAYWRNTALDHRSEIEHLRTALRDSVRPSELTIQKPMAYQITVGGKTPEWVEDALAEQEKVTPTRHLVTSVEKADKDYRKAVERRVELLKSKTATSDELDDARREAEVAAFAVARAREDAANELARLNKLLEDGGDR